jgi:pentatricopeptide repeat protein
LLTPVPHVRHLHTSLVALGGRNDGNLATQGLGAHSSRPILSKKAKKRAKSRREAFLRHPRGGMEGGGGEAGALAAGYQGGAGMLEARGKEEEEEAVFQGLTQASVRNRVAIESMLYSQPSPPRAGDVLRGEDGAAWVQHAKGCGAGKEGGQAWARAIRVFGAQGRFEAALGAFREMQRCGVPPTVYTYSALLGVCGDGSGAKEVWGALQRDVKAGVVKESPTGVAWGAYIQAHVRGGDLEGALGALKEAGEAGVPLSSTLWTHVIVGANKVGLYATAEACFHQMRTFHVQPDAVAFTALIHSYARRDMYEAARNVLWDMRDSGTPPTAVTYNALAYAAARSWRSCDEAHGVAASMAAAGFQKDAYTLTALLLACSQRGDVGRAREYLSEWVGQGGALSRDIFNNLITVYARALKKGVLPPGGGGLSSSSSSSPSRVTKGISSLQAARAGEVVARGGGVSSCSWMPRGL